MKIYLIGMPGSGKTTLGLQLASDLMLDFVDLDAEIVKHEGMPVPDIFQGKGEAYFRQVESDVLHEWAASSKSFVMATGGGAPCFLQGIEVINQTGLSIFLDVDFSEIMRRISSATHRPLLRASDDNERRTRLMKLLDTRLPVYRRAKITLHNPTRRDLLSAVNPRS